MSAEKFYRNIAIADIWPTKVSYPDTVVETRIKDQSSLLQRCNSEHCYFWIIAAEKEFFPQDKILLPMSYLPWSKKIPLSHFKLTAYVGRISRGDYRKVFFLLKENAARIFKIRQIIKNRQVAEILEMHYLGLPLMVRIRPTESIARIHASGLKIVISGNLEKIEPAQ